MAQLNGGHIAGIVIACVWVSVSAVFLLLFYLLRRRRIQARAANNDYTVDRKWPLVPGEQGPTDYNPSYPSPNFAWGGSTQYSSSPSYSVGPYSPALASIGGSTQYSPAQQPHPIDGQYSPAPVSFGGSTQCSPRSPSNIGTPSTLVQQPSPSITTGSPYHNSREQFSSQAPCGDPIYNPSISLYPYPSPFVAELPAALPKAVTAERILHTDKLSQIEEIHHSTSQTPQDLTVALGRTAFDSSKLGAIDETRAIDPYELEKKPNPVHFSNLYSRERSEAGPSDSNYSDVCNDAISKTGSDEPPRSLAIKAEDETSEHDLNKPTKSTQVFDISDYDGNAVSLTAGAILPCEEHHADMSPLVLPYLSPSIGTNSDDADMTEPDTPQTSTSSVTTDELQKGPSHRHEMPQCVFRLGDVPKRQIESVERVMPPNVKGKTPVIQTAMGDVPTRMMLGTSAIAPMSPHMDEPFSRETSSHVDIISGEEFPATLRGCSSSSPEMQGNFPTASTATPDEFSSPSNLRCARCPVLLFATQGKLNDHINRRHNRRYGCSLCAYRCSLRADLTRHLQTVHRDIHRPASTFHCPNDGCSTTWTRKDHLKRHVLRCNRQRQKLAEG
ncbi:hypothetical protein FB567DRAFT_154659 [Paraphoma chrysanthemicola]|uniref:C2H2-type domain-containing protein n=1 Tax=Paraphoma chrysanthemicola TaxID=798071 RepID=A0A8K0VU49_9PLEO|nr:hypothetical protein FB567DRAFT_154659 [Paraphoma chrysanthemicola]